MRKCQRGGRWERQRPIEEKFSVSVRSRYDHLAADQKLYSTAVRPVAVTS
jgi:hypothetical protein